MREINRKKLIEALNKVMLVVPKKNFTMQPFIRLAGNKLHASSMDMSITHPFEIMMNCVVPANELYGIVSKINDNTVTIEINESHLRIDGGSIKSGLTLMDEESIPDIPIVRGSWVNLPNDFMDALKFCLFSVAVDALNKDAYTCLKIMGNLVTSCDDFRATEYKMESDCPDFLLPLNAARVLVKYKASKIILKDNWIHFKCEEGTIINCLGLQVDYPNIDHVFNIDAKKGGNQIILPDNFSEIADRISIFSKEEHDMVRRINVSIKEGITIFQCESRGTGWAAEEVENNYKGEKLQFMANPDFLLELSKLSHKITIGKVSLLVEGENFRHVMGLVSD